MRIKGDRCYFLCFKSFGEWKTVSVEHYNFANDTSVEYYEIGEALA